VCGAGYICFTECSSPDSTGTLLLAASCLEQTGLRMLLLLLLLAAWGPPHAAGRCGALWLLLLAAPPAAAAWLRRCDGSAVEHRPAPLPIVAACCAAAPQSALIMLPGFAVSYAAAACIRASRSIHS
jgi:hypothetical protein